MSSMADNEKGAGRTEPTPFEKFRALTKQLVSVPKTEIDRREKARRKRPSKSA